MTTTARRVGRPPLPPEQKRSTSLRIKMTPAEHATIHALARHLGRPAGEIMRSAALQKARNLGIEDAAQ